MKGTVLLFAVEDTDGFPWIGVCCNLMPVLGLKHKLVARKESTGTFCKR